MEVETAMRRFLLGASSVTGYVQQKVFRHRLEEPIEGTSGRALVVFRNPGWAAPDSVKTSEFPVVLVDCYADPTRDALGEIAALDAEDKAFALARVVIPVLHGQRGVRWGAWGSNPGLMIVTCANAAEPRILSKAVQHGNEESLGDSVIVRTTWALQIAHG